MIRASAIEPADQGAHRHNRTAREARTQGALAAVKSGQTILEVPLGGLAMWIDRAIEPRRTCRDAGGRTGRDKSGHHQRDVQQGVVIAVGVVEAVAGRHAADGREGSGERAIGAQDVGILCGGPGHGNVESCAADVEILAGADFIAHLALGVVDPYGQDAGAEIRRPTGQYTQGRASWSDGASRCRDIDRSHFAPAAQGSQGGYIDR